MRVLVINTTLMNKLITPALGIIAVVSIAANILQAKRWSDARPLVTIGSQQITRGEYMSTVDAVTDGSVMKVMVLRSVVMQAARKHHVLPTADQIAARLTEVQQKQPAALDESSQGVAKVEQNRADIVAALALENLRIAGVDASDEDVDGYYKSHLQDFTVPKQVKTTFVITNDSVNTATAERLLESGMSAQDIAMHPGMHVAGVNSTGIDMSTLPDELRHDIQNSVFSMKKGDVRTFYDNRTALTYRIDESNDAYVPPLSAIRDEVSRQVKLEKAPGAQTELATAYREVAPQFDVPKYAAYFSGISNGGNVTTASLP